MAEQAALRHFYLFLTPFIAEIAGESVLECSIESIVEELVEDGTHAIIPQLVTDAIHQSNQLVMARKQENDFLSIQQTATVLLDYMMFEYLLAKVGTQDERCVILEKQELCLNEWMAQHLVQNVLQTYSQIQQVSDNEILGVIHDEMSCNATLEELIALLQQTMETSATFT
eukprot:TRINITY_DN8460_c0_g1_i3.p1 TRINITY_DN8460_c0_g1~~TRINITY_DN8460_c0_g1_i3.p1  ORF type:complete len:171 (-),score=39.85 TRINITY_DN8460_c0_g1_i3:167-679(-)